MIPGGAPAATAASRRILAASQVERFALGWGLKRMPLRVLRQMRDLKMVVEVGFVVGMMPHTTPTGSARVRMPAAGSELSTPQVRSSL